MTSFAAGAMQHPRRDCSHSKLSRFKDDFGAQKCSVCHKAPPFGWLYQCATDKVDDFTGAEIDDIEEEMRKFSIGRRPSNIPGQRMKDRVSDMTRFYTVGLEQPAPIKRGDLAAFHATNTPSRSAVPACNFKICPNCLPTYRQEAWPLTDHLSPNPFELSRRQGLDIQPASSRIRALTGGYHRSQTRYYNQIPPHLIDDYRSPSVSPTATTMEDEYFGTGNAAGKTLASDSTRPALPKSILDEFALPDDDDANVNHAADTVTAEDEKEDERVPPITIYAQDPALIRSQQRRSSLTPPPSPPPENMEALRARMTGSGSTTSSRVRGRYFDDATMKALQALEKKMDRVEDLDEDSKEKRAGRKLSKGRFFID